MIYRYQRAPDCSSKFFAKISFNHIMGCRYTARYDTLTVFPQINPKRIPCSLEIIILKPLRGSQNSLQNGARQARCVETRAPRLETFRNIICGTSRPLMYRRRLSIDQTLFDHVRRCSSMFTKEVKNNRRLLGNMEGNNLIAFIL